MGLTRSREWALPETYLYHGSRVSLAREMKRCYEGTTMKRPDALFSASAETTVRRKNLGEGDPPDPLKIKRST